MMNAKNTVGCCKAQPMNNPTTSHEWRTLTLARQAQDLYGETFEFSPAAQMCYQMDLSNLAGLKAAVLNGQSFPGGKIANITDALCDENELELIFVPGAAPNCPHITLIISGKPLS